MKSTIVVGVLFFYLALSGLILILAFLSRHHDRQPRQVMPPNEEADFDAMLAEQENEEWQREGVQE